MSTAPSLNKPPNLPPLYLNYMSNENVSLSKIILLTLYDFFDWWYIESPVRLSKYIGRISEVTLDQLSIVALLRTFFVPWHRDYRPLGRLMGLVMRLLYVPIALVIYILVMSFSLLILFGWILLPIVTVIMIFSTPLIS